MSERGDSGVWEINLIPSALEGVQNKSCKGKWSFIYLFFFCHKQLRQNKQMIENHNLPEDNIQKVFWHRMKLKQMKTTRGAASRARRGGGRQQPGVSVSRTTLLFLITAAAEWRRAKRDKRSERKECHAECEPSAECENRDKAWQWNRALPVWKRSDSIGMTPSCIITPLPFDTPITTTMPPHLSTFI